MRIKLISDLHLEHGGSVHKYMSPNEPADVLVVAGDLCVGPANVYRALKQLQRYHEHIIYVPGNHEYYGFSLKEFNTQLRILLANEPNIHFLYNEYVTIGGHNFIGTPLWTNFRYNPMAMLAARVMIADFKYIKEFTPDQSAIEFYNSLKFIKYCTATLPGTNVIVTHFMPAIECIAPQYKNEELLNKYFCNDLTNFISNLPPTLWFFGHTHSLTNTKINNTVLLANPKGYPDENEHYLPLVYDTTNS